MSLTGTTNKAPTRLSLAPVSYFWAKDTLYDFYARIADTPVDIVYLGETICSKRRSLTLDDWLELANMLTTAGKEVVLSTLTLVEAASELGAMQRICDSPGYFVEANDIAAVQMLSKRFSDYQIEGFVGGPALNLYNTRALNKLVSLGMKRWVMPVEHSAAVLDEFIIPESVETEVFAWGRLPLAYSARCYTARTHNTPKDDCELRCLDYPDGLKLSTREESSFLVLNGIQTQSALTHKLIHELNHPKVDIYRISPQSQFTEKVLQLFHNCLHDSLDPDQADKQLEKYAPFGTSNGYWHGNAGMTSQTPSAQ